MMRRAIFAIGLSLALGAVAQADTQFYRELDAKDVGSWGDVLHAGYILHAGKNETKTFEEYRKYALDNELIDKGWDFPADAPVTKGRLAFVVVRALHIKGGVFMNLLGTTQRYAYRELLYLNLMGKASQHKYISGKELLSVLRRGMEYRRAHAPAGK